MRDSLSFSLTGHSLPLSFRNSITITVTFVGIYWFYFVDVASPFTVLTAVCHFDSPPLVFCFFFDFADV